MEMTLNWEAVKLKDYIYRFQNIKLFLAFSLSDNLVAEQIKTEALQRGLNLWRPHHPTEQTQH